MKPRWMMRRWMMRIGTMVLAVGFTVAMHAQYPGRIDPQQKQAATSTLRSIAVLEWTGDRTHPKATRLVPISLFDGEHLQDGALYLARPVPLALDSGTEYEVETSGVPQGWFDVAGARQIGDDWFGFGDWKPYVPPPPKKLQPSRTPPTVVRDRKPEDDRPHFVRRDQEPAAGSTAGQGTAGSSSPGQGTPEKGSPAPGSASQEKAPAPAAPVDPDRPRLRRRNDEAASTPPPPASAPETPSAATDPDRPRLSYGKPAELKDAPKALEVTPVNLGQTVAVSDADAVSTLSFAYEWGSPADATNAQKELESQAVQLLASNASGAPAATGAPSVPSSRATARSGAKAASHRRQATVGKHKATAAKPDARSSLTEVHFSAFALTYGSGATLVLTANQAATTRSIAVVAMQDIYGKVKVLWHSITDDTHLDVTPRTTLVDAVDPRGDGRANLLFEQRNANDRRFVLYAVGATTAEPVFATDPLPLHPVAQAGQ